jgi:hypothetical protein
MLFLLAPAVAAAGLLAGCGTGQVTIAPKGEAPVTLGSEGRRTTHTAQHANRITITLPPADAATHKWHISSHDARFLKQLTDVLPPKPGETAQTITFLAIRTGTTRLRFVLLPISSAREATPIDAHDLVLTIQ